jgi:hypothetical protein
MASHTPLLKLLAYLTLAGLAGRAENWNARWIAAEPDGAVTDLRMPIFRCAVRLDKPIARAAIDISGLGQYELTVNGRRIGDAVLAPGWTNYRKTVYYNTYDVTAALRPGENAIGVMLGNGFFNVPGIPGRYTKFTGSFGQPQLIARFRVRYRGGGGAEIATDAHWKWHPGPIVVSHAYGGEDYDARLEQTGWDQSGFDDREWAPALEVAGPGGNLVAQVNPEIRVMQVFHPVKTTEPRPGVKVYDFGQNFSGWPAITVRGTAGASLKMIPGELLDANGLVSQRSSGAPQWFSYTLKGTAEETWSPRFSYYGFRYVQVEPSGDAELAAIEGRFIHAAAPQIGEFSCSNDLFNRIHKLIDAAILSNMQNVLTDCPHREKLGWLEQDHLLGSSVMYNYGVASLYRKIADDMAEAQTPEGLVPDIAPEYTVFANGFRDSPEWGSAVVLCPWLAYKHFGDRDTLAAHYDAMQRYVDYLAGKAVNGIIAYGLGDWYDIGPRRPGVSQLTSLGVTATAIYYQDLVTMRAIARVLGKTADEDSFARQAEATRAAFNAQLFDPGTGVYDRGSQTAYAMPLALGLVPEERRAAVLDKLVGDIVAHRNHTTAGDIGFHYVIQALSEGGRSDVVYDMLSNPEPPSYAAQLSNGATTLTEAWDADPASSQNHFMLGHAEEWFYRYLAGIDFDASRPPDERLVLRPTPVGDIVSAQARYQTPLGAVSSSWRRSGARLTYDVEIPANATAKLLLPGQPPRQIRSGRHRFRITTAPDAR